MSEIKPTPGPWTVAGENAAEPDVMSGEYFVATCLGFADQDQALVNARLIAEAGTVFHNTGLSPVQLVEQRDELLAALRKMVAVHEYPADNLLQPSKEQLWISMANAALSMARAALAKCEGVGNDRA